jgi:hypothetical protein
MRKILVLAAILLVGCLAFAQNYSPDIRINHFSTSSISLVEGENFTASWDVSAVDSVQILLYHDGMRIYADTPIPSYASVGTASFSAPEGMQSAELILIVNENLQETIDLYISCRYEWMSVNTYSTCPSAEAAEIPAIYQSFEHGYMISSALNEYLWIYAYEWGNFQVMPADMPYISIFSEAAPNGLLRPTGDFEMLWERNPYIRETLGWADAVEQHYNMSYQVSVWSMGTKGNRDYIFELPDGRLIIRSISGF